MQPITRLLLALAVVASARAHTHDHCSTLRLGLQHNPIGIKIREVTTTYLTKDKHEKVYIPTIPQRKDTWFSAKITACNRPGHKPFLIKTSNITAEMYCTYQDKLRCPHGIAVEVVESYNDGPLIPKLG